MRSKTQLLTLNGVIAAAYAALTLVASAMNLAYGPVQFRFSEALTVLPFLFPGTWPGLFVGCLVANLLSPYGPIDIVIGSLATLLAAIWTEKVDRPWLAPLPPVLCNMVLVGGMLAWYEVGFTAQFAALFAVNALWVGIVSALIGLALVMVWLVLFYGGLGFITGLSVCLMAIIYMGLLALLSSFGWFSLTLPGIAGIIVNIGLSADSSILIMECFHEQVRNGRSVKAAAQGGAREGIFTSIDADVVTLVSALVLYFVAIGDVRGFGLTLALGIICDLLVMFLFSGPIVRMLGDKQIAKHPGFWGMRDEINEGEFIAKEVR